MHSIVASILLTDRGKKYVREHEIDFNVQKVYKKLVNFYANSTAARVNASNSFNHATSAKIDSWKGVTEAFIMHWQDQTRQCESLVDDKSYFSDNQKKILLENTVASLQSLCATKDQAGQLQTHNGDVLEYDQYLNLLLSAANNHDNQFTPASSKTSRRTCNAEIDKSDFYPDSEYRVKDDAEYDINASAATLLANLSNRSVGNSASCIPSADYRLLTPEAKVLWGMLPNDMKAVILKGRDNNINSYSDCNKDNFNNAKPRFNQCETVKPPNCKPNPFTKANLHELLTELLVEEEETGGIDRDAEDSDNINESCMLVNSASASRIKPGDMRNSYLLLIALSPHLLQPINLHRLKLPSNQKSQLIEKRTEKS